MNTVKALATLLAIAVVVSLAFVFVTDVSANHLNTPEPVESVTPLTDAEALKAYDAEYGAQLNAILDSLRLYRDAESAGEKRDAMLSVEIAFSKGIEHMQSVEVRECYAAVHEAALAYFEAGAEAFAVHKETGEPLDFSPTQEPFEELVRVVPLAFAACADPVEVVTEEVVTDE